MQKFLATCRYVSDEEQFGERDYWLPPELFEESNEGDCEDFAIWVWRQLLQMNYEARLVVGTASRYGEGHAWVTFEKDGKFFLLESLSWPVGLMLPRLSAFRYKPTFSVGWDGKNISYYQHKEKKFSGSAWQIAVLCGEWLFFWLKFWIALPLKVLRKYLRRAAGAMSGKI